MKKTTVKPDGTQETWEGTPEEMAAYDKALTSTPAPYRELKTYYCPAIQWPQHADSCPVEIAKRGWWSVTPPVCTCGRDPNFWPITITSTFKTE